MEQKQQHKKPWEKPELVILVRGNPAEAVLLACKAADAFSSNGCAICSASDTVPS